MKPSHSLRVTYRLPVVDSTAVDSAYFSVWSLSTIDLVEEGFKSNEVNLSYDSSLTNSGEVIEPTAKLGKEVAVRYGCVACHATGESDIPAPPTAGGEGGAQIAVGPAWTGLWGTRREFTDSSFIKKADETYLRESLLDPGRRVPVGYETEKNRRWHALVSWSSQGSRNRLSAALHQVSQPKEEEIAPNFRISHENEDTR